MELCIHLLRTLEEAALTLNKIRAEVATWNRTSSLQCRSLISGLARSVFQDFFELVFPQITRVATSAVRYTTYSRFKNINQCATRAEISPQEIRSDA
jgi:hypothetical protein